MMEMVGCMVDVLNDIVLVRRWNNSRERNGNYETIELNNKEENKTDDKAVSKALKAMRDVLTGYVLIRLLDYINVSVKDYIAEDALEALKAMQQIDTLRPDGFVGSIPFSSPDFNIDIENSVSYVTSYAEFSIWIILKISHTNHRIIHNGEQNKMAGREASSQPNKSLPQDNIFTYSKYLNILVDSNGGARMAERLLRLPYEQFPSTRSEGSTPSPGASASFYAKLFDKSQAKVRGTFQYGGKDE